MHRRQRNEAASADGGRERRGRGRASVVNLPVVGWEDVPVLRRATSPVLIGRAGERARLDAAFRSASAGAPVTVLVAGEAGIGKTRLVTEFANDVCHEARVLAGACIDERVPYSPVADVLRSLARSGWEPGDVGERGWADLGALVPELGWSAGGPRRAGEDGSPGRLQGAFLLLVEELGRERPVVVIVEDLHWSDASTRNLLMYAMRVARDVPLLLVGTYRTDDITRRHPLRPFLAEAARLPSTDAVELDRLETAGVAQLLAELLERSPPPGMVDDVYGRCGGNPFLVEEVVAAGVDGRSGRLPRRLQDILLARTISVSPQAAEVLSIAAVGGPRIDDGLLRRVCSLAPEALDAALRELLDCHVLEPDADDRGYVFRHALTAEAVYDEALPGERVRLHATFARAISEDPDLATAGGTLAAVERARHWHRARHGTEALLAWVEAATAAERVYAHPEALAAYENALELWPTIDGAEALAGLDEVELLRRATEAAYRAGSLVQALTLAQSALTLLDERRDPLRAAMLNERLGRCYWASGREADALAHYQRAVELAPQHPATAERARALAGHAQILMLNWLDAPAARFAQDAIDAARQVGAVAVEAHALNTLAMAKCWMGDEAGSLAAMDESARLTERSGDDDNVSRLWVNRMELLFTLCHVDEAATVARQGCAALRDIGLARSNGAYMAGYAYFPLVELGCWDEAHVILDDAIGIAQSGWWLAWPLQSRAWLNWLTGDIEQAERDLADIQQLALEQTEGQFLAAQAQAVAAVAIETEHWDKAVQTVADIGAPASGGRGRARRALANHDRRLAGLVGRRRPGTRTGKGGFRLAGSSSRRTRSATRCSGAAAQPAHRPGPSPPRAVRGGASTHRGHRQQRPLATSRRRRRRTRSRRPARLRPGAPCRDVAGRGRRPQPRRGHAQRRNLPLRRRATVADPCARRAGRPAGETPARRAPQRRG